MNILCLDLSSVNTGYSIFHNSKVVKKGNIRPSKKLKTFEKLAYIVKNIVILYKKIDILVIEGLYYGINFDSIIYLARLSGAVIYEWVKHSKTEPIIYVASHARKLVGIAGNAHKAEVQVFILEYFKLVNQTFIHHYKTIIDKLKLNLKNKKIDKKQYKKEMEKLSRQIEEETDYDENICDSLVLGLAYNKENLL